MYQNTGTMLDNNMEDQNLNQVWLHLYTTKKTHRCVKNRQQNSLPCLVIVVIRTIVLPWVFPNSNNRVRTFQAFFRHAPFEVMTAEFSLVLILLYICWNDLALPTMTASIVEITD